MPTVLRVVTPTRLEAYRQASLAFDELVRHIDFYTECDPDWTADFDQLNVFWSRLNHKLIEAGDSASAPCAPDHVARMTRELYHLHTEVNALGRAADQRREYADFCADESPSTLIELPTGGARRAADAFGRIRARRDGLVDLTAVLSAEVAKHECAAQGADVSGDSPSHAPDFSWVRCALGDFTFSASQRPVIAALWKDWEASGLGLGQAYLLDQAGSDSRKELRGMFKGDPAWQTLIVSGKRKDTYRLELPARQA